MKALLITFGIIGVTGCSQALSRIQRATTVCTSQADGTTFPVDGKCGSYYYCANQTPVELPCPNNMQFSVSQGGCVSSASSGCQEGVLSTTTPTTTSPIPTVVTKSDGGLTGNECYGQAQGALIPYPGDCTKYLVCQWYDGTVMDCPRGLHFNPVLCVCDWPTSAGCTQGSNPTASTSTSTTSISTSKTTPPMTPTATPTSSSTPIETSAPTTQPTVATTSTPTPTSSSTPTEPSIPTSTPTSRPTNSPTTFSTSASTPTLGPDNDICINQPDGALFPYPWDCDWYIRCKANAPEILPCESGWVFNPNLLICDYPANAGCIPTPYPTTTSTPSTLPATTSSSTPSSTLTTAPTATAPITTTTTPISISSSTPTSTSISESSPTLGPDDVICANQPDGALFPYPWDCAWYIRCKDNAPETLPCENGWVFNPNFLICDYPVNAGCIATPYPTTTSTPSTLPATTSSSTPSSTLTTTPTATAPVTTTTTPIFISSSTPTSTSISESSPTLGPDDVICANQPDGALFPYSWDCAWYIRCKDNAPETLPCENGWVFNPTLLICDYPANAGCIATPSTLPTTISSSTPSSTLRTIPTTTAATTMPTLTPVTATTPISTFTPTPTLNPTSTTESPPTVEPNDDICTNQPDGAYFPYPWDCAWYIRCGGNTAEVRPCQAGWLFNPILLICDYPANAGCIATPYPTTTATSSPTTRTTSSFRPTPPTVTTSDPSTNPPYVGTGICANQELGTLLPYPGKCSLYIVCEEPAPIAISCGSDLEFNAALKSCQPPEEAGCSIIRTTSTEVTTIDLTTTPSIGSGICANYPIGDLVPYPGNCSQYIRCELPVPIALECLNDLEFNAQLQLCESAEDAGCSSLPGTTTIVPDTPTTPPSQPEMSGVCRGQQEGDLIPYPGDCSKYIICENPIPVAQRCGAGLNFNENLGICDEPDSAGCPDDSGSTTIPPQTTTQSPGTPGLIGVCKDYTEGDLIPYPGSCTKYIRCELPVPIAQTCKSGLYFNQALGICDTTESATCPGYSTTTNPAEGPTTIPTTTPPNPPPFTGVCHGQESGNLIPYPDNCSKYILCENPVPIAKACTGGLHFNAELQICDDPVAAGCEATPSTTLPTSTPTPSTSNVCCGIPIGEFIPYPEDCTQYIRCEYPIPTVFSCSNELHFNAVTQQCETIESANCQWYTTTTTTTTTAAPLTCDTQPNGTLLPYDGDCKKYYYCSNGASVPLPCPVGTIFSQDAGGCVPGSVCPN